MKAPVALAIGFAVASCAGNRVKCGRPAVEPTPPPAATAALPADTGKTEVTGTARSASDSPVSQAPKRVWQPRPGVTWQWQLKGPIDLTVDAEVFDIDLFDVPAEVVSALHAKGRKVICYMSAGSFEDWRPDAASFPPVVKGKPLEGWPGERWLDIRRLDLLGPIMEKRLDLCRSKGFDAAEFDNVDGYQNKSGFPLTAAHQLAYNRFLAKAAHARGLSAGLKNDLDQIPELVDDFDWALSEECFAYDECHRLQPFIAANKAVFVAEYNLPASAVCAKSKQMRLSTLIKPLSLEAKRETCPP